MASRIDVAKAIAEDDTAFHYVTGYIYDNPDIFEDEPEARVLIMSYLSKLSPEQAGDFGDADVFRGQPERDIVGHPRGFASWASNTQFAKYFADAPGYRIYQTEGPIRGVRWSDIAYHRTISTDEHWGDGAAGEYLVINPEKVNIIEGKKAAMKPFRTFLAEQEQDYEYKLCSVENIHTTEMMEKLRLALGRYGLIELDPQGIQTQITAAEKSEFNQYPFLPVFIVKVVLANPLSSVSAVQSISLFTRIKDDKLKFFDKDSKIVMDGAENEQHAHPVEVDSKGSQSEVGDEHAQALVSDLMKDIIARREASTVEIPVYEGFTATHHDVAKIIGRAVHRGFYLAENTADGWGIIRGPYKRFPANYDYVSVIPTATLMESATVDNLMEYKVKYAEAEHQGSPSDGGGKDVAKSMEVAVTDQDTGKEHSVVVKAVSSNAARAKAVEILAARLGVGKERLIPTSPVATEN